MLGWVLLVACALGWPAGGGAQNSLYSSDGCRIVDRGAVEVNVTCECRQYLRQTRDSVPIDHLTIVGCVTGDAVTPDAARAVQIAFVDSDSAPDFVLRKVRSVNVSASELRLLPVARRPEQAAAHPLQTLHMEYSRLEQGLADRALQGMGSLREISLLGVSAQQLMRSSLSDLPQLRSLSIDGSEVGIFNEGVLSRVPRLRRLQIADSEITYVRSGAIVVEADEDDGPCMDAAPASVASTSDPADEGLFIRDSKFTTMSLNAIRFAGAEQLVLAGNTIRELYRGALNVTLRTRCAGRPLVNVSSNSLEDVRDGALTVRADGDVAVPLALGDNGVTRGALSPLSFLLDGRFERLQGDEWSRAHPDRYSCGCCDCLSTQRLIELALNESADGVERDVFVGALKTAVCFGEEEKSFLAFADGCKPEVGLEAHLFSKRKSAGGMKGSSGTDGEARPKSAVVSASLLVLLSAAIGG